MDRGPLGCAAYNQPSAGLSWNVSVLSSSCSEASGMGTRRHTARSRCAGFSTQEGSVVPIPRAKNAQQAAHNAAALSFQLTPDEIGRLDQATRRWRTA